MLRGRGTVIASNSDLVKKKKKRKKPKILTLYRENLM